MKPLTLTGKYVTEASGWDPKEVSFGVVASAEHENGTIKVYTVDGREFRARAEDHSGLGGHDNLQAFYIWRLGR